MAITDRIKLVRQQSVHPEGEEWELEVPAPNRILARQRARLYVRAVAPGARNIVDPEIVGTGNTEQSSIREFFPESLEQKKFRIEVFVVR